MSAAPPPIEKIPEPIPSQPQEKPFEESLETKTQKAAGSVIPGTEKSTWKKSMPHRQVPPPETASPKGVEPKGVVAKVKAEHPPGKPKGRMGKHTVKEISIQDMWAKEIGKMNWKKVNQYLKKFAPSAPEFQQTDLEGNAEEFFKKLSQLPKLDINTLRELSYEATTPSKIFHKKEQALAARMFLAANSYYRSLIINPNTPSHIKKIGFLSARLPFETWIYKGNFGLGGRREIARESTWIERKFATEMKEGMWMFVLMSIPAAGAPLILIPIISAPFAISYSIKILIEKVRQGNIVNLGKRLERKLEEELVSQTPELGQERKNTQRMLEMVRYSLDKIKRESEDFK
jgi:hypothetical protein